MIIIVDSFFSYSSIKFVYIGRFCILKSTVFDTRLFLTTNEHSWNTVIFEWKHFDKLSGAEKLMSNDIHTLKFWPWFIQYFGCDYVSFFTRWINILTLKLKLLNWHIHLFMNQRKETINNVKYIGAFERWYEDLHDTLYQHIVSLYEAITQSFFRLKRVTWHLNYNDYSIWMVYTFFRKIIETFSQFKENTDSINSFHTFFSSLRLWDMTLFYYLLYILRGALFFLE